MNGIIRLSGKIGRQIMKCKPIAKAVVKVSHNKPEIMAIAGGAAVITAVVLAAIGGTKLKEEMAEGAEKVEAVEKRQAMELNADNLTEEQKAMILKACGKDLRKARAEGVWRVVKLFILPGGLLVVGLALIGGGHHILRKRNIVLASTLKGTEEILKFYRSNVVEAEGEEADLKYMRGIVGEKEIESVHVDKDGKETKTKQKVPVIKQHKNPWRFEFSETWFDTYKDDSESNLFYLKCNQDFWNKRYEEYGEISMYEVLRNLGYRFEIEREGVDKKTYNDRMTFLRNYGWRKGSGGDDMIDFGLYRAINAPAITRKSDVIWIEFNCDGNLSDLDGLNVEKWR